MVWYCSVHPPAPWWKWGNGSHAQLDEDTGMWKTERVSRKVDLPSSTAPTYLSPVSLSHHIKALHPPGYLATWHLALFGCLATWTCNHNIGSCAAHPPARIPLPPVSLIPFFTPEKSALLLLLSILYLAVNPLSASPLEHGLPTYSLLSCPLFFSLPLSIVIVLNHA